MSQKSIFSKLDQCQQCILSSYNWTHETYTQLLVYYNEYICIIQWPPVYIVHFCWDFVRKVLIKVIILSGGVVLDCFIFNSISNVCPFPTYIQSGWTVHGKMAVINHIYAGRMSLSSAVQEIPTVQTSHGIYQDYFYILFCLAPTHRVCLNV